MTNEQCYEILGLSPGASEREIRDARKRLAIKWTPDRQQHNPELEKLANEKLKEINVAHNQLIELLKNPSYRKMNDQENKQSPNIYHSTPTPVKRKSSRLGIIALGILVVFITICGSSVYLGSWFFRKNDTTSSEKEQTPKRAVEESNNLQFNTSDNEEIIAERNTASKLTSINFTPNKAVLGLQYGVIDQLAIDIELAAMELYNNKELLIKFSICNNTGREQIIIDSLKFWYTPSSTQNTINWKPSSGQLSLKYGECKLFENWSEKTDYKLVKPFGIIYVQDSQRRDSINLDKISSDGHIQSN